MRKVLIAIVVVLALFILTHATTETAQAAGPAYYVVQPGQSMYSIAGMYGISAWSLAYANGMWNPNTLYVGQVLVIPYAGYNGYGRNYYNPYPYYHPYPYSYYSRPTYGCYYWVRWGDTMTSIAWRFGGDPWRIARANGIYNLNWIYAGQRLFIPGCN